MQMNSYQPDSQPNKKQKQEEAKAEAEKLRLKRKGAYKTWSKTYAHQDLMAFVDRMYETYTHSAIKGVGVIDGKTTSLTSEQKMSLIDTCNGFDIIKTYINNNLS